MKKIAVILILAVMTLCGCRIQDQRELVVKVPQMKTEDDAAKVRTSLLPLRGVDLEHARFDLAAQTVTLSFDSMVIAHKNIEIAIAEAGYDANEVAAIKK
ncbi:MAG: heavy-metal-associated domain-containing protein [Kiritimatiellae bacterium]|nr:heavy-metal-associated domain-containing protein [Kiritimatiellia bacterium]